MLSLIYNLENVSANNKWDTMSRLSDNEQRRKKRMEEQGRRQGNTEEKKKQSKRKGLEMTSTATNGEEGEQQKP